MRATDCCVHSDQKEPPYNEQWKYQGSVSGDAGMMSNTNVDAVFKEVCKISRESYAWKNVGVITKSGFGDDGCYPVYTYTRSCNEEPKSKEKKQSDKVSPITALNVRFIYEY